MADRAAPRLKPEVRGWLRHLWRKAMTLSRARTEEMTCALPAASLGEIVADIEAAAELDRAMARYASADARRLSPLR